MKRSKTGPKPGPNGNRVRLCGHNGPFVDPHTKGWIDSLRTAYGHRGVTTGSILDDLVNHGRTKLGFKLGLKRSSLVEGPQMGLKAKETPQEAILPATQTRENK
jgi:hypothetical protein